MALLQEQICPTGISGLDSILGGGLPPDCMYLIQGDPGSGKTTLALQFLLEGIKRGERVFYVTLSETRAELLKVARSHGWDLEPMPLLELSALQSVMRPDQRTTVFHPSEMEMGAVKKILLEQIEMIRPERLVFDSLSEFRLMAETPLRYRRELLTLKQEFMKYATTAVFLDDKMDIKGLGVDPHILSLAHGVIDLEQVFPEYGISRRRLRVRKLRGLKFREGYHDYNIRTGGLRIYPRLVAAEHRADFSRQPVSSGIKELDELLGGGLDRGTTTLISGQAGTGKSTLALHYCAQVASKGESAVYFTFDEISGVLLARADQLGLNLKKYGERVTIRQIDPAEISPGEFASDILEAVESGCRMVVVDSLNGYLQAMPGEKYLNNQLHELFTYLNQQGILTVVTLAHTGLLGNTSGLVDVSYLADTVLSLRFFEHAGEIKKSLAVIKKRSGRHERSIREFKLESNSGISIGVPLKDFRGVLTGVPEFIGSAKDILR